MHGELSAWNPGPGAVMALAVAGSRVAAITPYMGVIAFDATSGSLAWEVAADSTGGALASEGAVIYVGGAFQTIGGVARARLAALDENGAVTTWNPGANDMVLMLVARNGTLYAQGSFTSVGGEPREGLAAIASSGAILPWAARVPTATAMTATDSFVYLGGALYVNDEQPGNGGLVKLDRTGHRIPWSPELPEGPSPAINPAQIFALAADESTVYVGGSFGWSGQANGHSLTALDPSGAALPFRDYTDGNAVRALFLQGSRLWVGGDFTAIGNHPAQGFALIER